MAESAGESWIRQPWTWAVFGVFLIVVCQAIFVKRMHESDFTGLYMLTEPFYQSTYLHEVYPPGVIRYTNGAYDPFYFLSLANDPLVLHQTNTADFPIMYRGRRIFWPWVGYALGLGHPRLILVALPVSQWIVLGFALLCLAKLLVENGRLPAWSLLHAVSLGTAVCTLRPLCDLFATNLLIIGAYLFVRERFRWASAVFAAACLTRETSLLVPFVLSLWQLSRRDVRRSILTLAPSLLAFFGWCAWLRWHYPLYVGSGVFGIPFEAILTRLRSPFTPFQVDEVAALLATLISMFAVFFAVRRYWEVWRISAALYVTLGVLANISIWDEYWCYGRALMTIPALLLFSYAIHGRKTDLIGPVASAVAGCLVLSWGMDLPQAVARHVHLPTLLSLQEPLGRLYRAGPSEPREFRGLPWVDAGPRVSLRQSLPHLKRGFTDLTREYSELHALRIRARAEVGNARAFGRILCNSYFSRESILRAYGLDATVNYLGVDTDLFTPISLPKEAFVIGLGAMAHHKGLDRAILSVASIERIRRPTLVWIGNAASDTYLDEMKALALASGVEFVPKLLMTQEELIEDLSKAAAMIYTSRLEPFGFAPLGPMHVAPFPWRWPRGVSGRPSAMVSMVLSSLPAISKGLVGRSHHTSWILVWHGRRDYKPANTSFRSGVKNQPVSVWNNF